MAIIGKILDIDYSDIQTHNPTKVGFMKDSSIWESGAYQFTINNEHNRPSPNDAKLKTTLYRLVEAFFEANQDILLYICETGDDKQRFRNRLFVRWFNNYSRRDEFVLKTAEVLDESVVNFAAMIVQRSHPRLNVILNDFDETIALLQK